MKTTRTLQYHLTAILILFSAIPAFADALDGLVYFVGFIIVALSISLLGLIFTIFYYFKGTKVLATTSWTLTILSLFLTLMITESKLFKEFPNVLAYLTLVSFLLLAIKNLQKSENIGNKIYYGMYAASILTLLYCLKTDLLRFTLGNIETLQTKREIHKAFEFIYLGIYYLLLLLLIFKYIREQITINPTNEKYYYKNGIGVALLSGLLSSVFYIVHRIPNSFLDKLGWTIFYSLIIGLIATWLGIKTTTKNGNVKQQTP